MTQVYKTEYLTKDDIKGFADLQMVVLAALPEGKKHFLKPRSEKDLLAHFDDGMPIIGAKDENGKLVAGALMSYPSRDAVMNIDDYPISNKHTTAVIQSLMCHPDHEGKGLGKHIVQVAVDLAAQKGLGCVVAKVAQDNPSHATFIKGEFVRAAWAVDQNGNYPVWFMKHDIYPNSIKVSPEAAFETSLKKGDMIVIKFGGAMVSNEEVMGGILRQAIMLKEAGYNPLLVMGGGSQISEALEGAGIPTTKVNGERVTCTETMKVMTPLMDTLALDLAKKMAAEAKKMHLDIKPVAMGGYQDGIIFAETSNTPGMGPHNGEITQVDVAKILSLMEGVNIPIIHPVCLGPDGAMMNVNADKVALAIAEEMKVAKLVFASDIDGVKNKYGEVITAMYVGEEQALIADGTISGGMIPKIVSAMGAVEHGVRAVTILNGAKPYSILQEMYTKAGTGTQIAKPPVAYITGLSDAVVLAL